MPSPGLAANSPKHTRRQTSIHEVKKQGYGKITVNRISVVCSELHITGTSYVVRQLYNLYKHKSYDVIAVSLAC